MIGIGTQGLKIKGIDVDWKAQTDPRSYDGPQWVKHLKILS